VHAAVGGLGQVDRQARHGRPSRSSNAAPFGQPGTVSNVSFMIGFR
jgi:hypothetical protein